MKDYINPVTMESCLSKENQIIYNEFEKVYDEFITLSIKVSNLTHFIKSGRIDDISNVQKELLLVQLDNMKGYLSTLKSRLTDFIDQLFFNSI